MTNDVKSLEEIDALRSRLGVAQREMCEVAEVAESTLSRNRASEREPTPRIRRRLARALETIAARRGVAIVDVDARVSDRRAGA